MSDSGSKPKSRSRLHYERRSVGQSILVSRPIWGPRPDFCYCQTIVSMFMGGALFDERMDLSFTISVDPRQYSHSRVGLPQPGSPGPLFIFPRNWVVQLYPRHWVPFSSSPTTRRTLVKVLSSQSELLYDWQFTANQFVLAPIPLRITTRDTTLFSLCNFGTDRTDNTSTSSSTFAFTPVA
jgi:hypothetical protein